jgi:hypothetical protein
MEIKLNMDSLQNLGNEMARNAAADLQPGFDRFQSKLAGKSADEVETALRSWLATTPLQFPEEAIKGTAQDIVNGVPVKLQGPPS